MLEHLADLLPVVTERGWAAGQAGLPQIRAEARRLGWAEVANRQGEPSVTTLRAVDPSDAHPNSLSSRYGKGEQPLHTDGAHLQKPPDFIVLASDVTNNTPTLISESGRGPFRAAMPPYVQHGVFLVQNGKNSFYSTAYSGGRIRYDPGCMTPCDARAKQAVKFFAEREVLEFTWYHAGMFLLMDNRRILHARGSAVGDPQRVLQRVSFHGESES
ncbi:hypothetical protein ACFCYM_03330 [Streptomyces sp. NPDC056254]|uniref:hypothetical protein n=1 Tax=Streptomyces sp. NPDC056254 TaxID=3345763 RepID=UPI0035DE4091